MLAKRQRLSAIAQGATMTDRRQTDATRHRHSPDRDVLVVEDSYLYAELLRSTLLDAGAEVVVAVPSASSALDALKSRRFSFATLDIDLNGRDSFAVADALVAQRVPFVFVSSDSPWRIPAVHQDKALLGKSKLNEIVSAFATVPTRSERSRHE